MATAVVAAAPAAGPQEVMEEDAPLPPIAETGAQRLAQNAPNVRLRPDWLRANAGGLEDWMSADMAAQTLLERVAAGDLRSSCLGSLPNGLDRQHDVRVEGSHLIQILQLVDISKPQSSDAVPMDYDPEQGAFGRAGGPTQQPQRPEANESMGPNDTLKVCFTDGAQVLCGIERRPVATLRTAKPGALFVLSGRPLLRRGLFMLEPQHLEPLKSRT
mmetsp:Transcript_98746/g.205829  ORF Transcript_98746/g.205829 Transcript_98746/m.205829 type:complete len:216 (+) Transcript_98746:125-772(+)|eukprot:CAMPEP_0206609502 /NCGR_PEP_ID=MMETSP0325_2-20121206/53830_1 /ASSEMBLY_ACC=CAM_ASM_000347 /TAXON_ID=2866 /ORGANISM="Crypthecodinium cohnii, Strain Seligo" /LENGTH=215 /DNA_ID=CAMNT_0054127811 /DNA_START=29 /DNA_END=676 /DNA_ORIENTATION=+